MKNKILTIILTATVVFAANAQIVNIPDANFKAYLVGNSAINTNGDSEIQVSEAQAFAGGILPGGSSGIADLTGLEAFIAVTHFAVGSNLITSIDVSNNTALFVLDVENTQITSIDISNNTALTDLNLFNNQLTSVDVTNNTALKKLYLHRNQLTSIDVSNNPELTYLDCWENQLTSLDVSNNHELTYLACFSNQLTSLNVANGNNVNFTHFVAAYNPNLFCIQVDDETISSNWISGTNGFLFDSQSVFTDGTTICDNTTSVTEITENKQKISVYPNPTNNQINFAVQTNAQLTNATGQVVANKTNVNSLDLTDLPTGVYFLTLTADNGQILQRSKIVKE